MDDIESKSQQSTGNNKVSSIFDQLHYVGCCHLPHLVLGDNSVASPLRGHLQGHDKEMGAQNCGPSLTTEEVAS